jgi:hypothetical protein
MDKFTFRRAVASDVLAIVALLADDQLGPSREAAVGGSDDAYRRAFAAVDADPDQFLCVMEAAVKSSACSSSPSSQALAGGGRGMGRSRRCGSPQPGADRGSAR